jgi:glycerate-2-kinase
MSIVLVPGNTLMTASAEDGRQLAFKLARLAIKATQPDDAIRGKLRDVYASDAAMLMQAGHTVAVEFATIAAANRYWREDA